MRALAQASLGPFDERFDELRLELGPELRARLDRGLQLLALDTALFHRARVYAGQRTVRRMVYIDSASRSPGGAAARASTATATRPANVVPT